jgi:ubiquinone/menaquinone biosynthesis C-methylase UbiE
MLSRFGGRLEPHRGPHNKRHFGGLYGTIVEIGPGVGANLPYLPKGVTWIGVEPNWYMHERLLAQARRVGVDAEVRTGAAEDLPIADNTADAVIGTLVLCSVVDQRRALQEVLRVLKPGGTLVFIEHVAAPRGSSLRRLQRWLRPLWSRLGDGCHPDRETRAELEQAGFDTVSIEAFTAPVPVVSPHIAGRALKGPPTDGSAPTSPMDPVSTET